MKCGLEFGRLSRGAGRRQTDSGGAGGMGEAGDGDEVEEWVSREGGGKHRKDWRLYSESRCIG